MTCITTQVTKAEAPILSLQEQYEKALDEWVDDLFYCESQGDPNAVNWNDGGSPSYGPGQYKLGTFWSYNNRLKVFPDLTLDNLHRYVMDEDKSRIMTKAIINNKWDDWTNWTNCSSNPATPNYAGKPPQKPV